MRAKQVLRQAVTIITAFILAYAIVELIVRFILGFPPAEISGIRHIYPRDMYKGKRGYEYLYNPGARYFNVENGYRILRRNNFGLPGKDLQEQGKKNILVLGNSFVEARGTDPDKLATSVFMDYLEQRYPGEYQVLNLGVGGQPPHFGLYKAAIWGRSFPPHRVILVLEKSMLKETSMWADSVFAPDEQFGSPVKDRGRAFGTFVFNHSAFANLLNVGWYYARSKAETAENGKQKVKYPPTNGEVVYQRMLKVLARYQHLYGAKFMVYSLLDRAYDQKLERDCKKLGIVFEGDPDVRKTFGNHMGKGVYGHFNDRGNRALGMKLGEFYLAHAVEVH